MVRQQKIAFLIFVVGFVNLTAQKPITLEDIYSKFTFRTKSVPGFSFLNDGKHYSALKDGEIKKYDLTTGSLVETIYQTTTDQKNLVSGKIEKYTFNHDESSLLLETEGEPIYRHSSQVKCYIVALKSGIASEIYPFGKIINPTFSPDGDKVAFVFKNNLYYKNLKNQTITQITTDGEKNKIINGMPDWVYEEEFGFTKAFYWSPDSKKIAFIRFDEKEVPMFTMQLYDGSAYPMEETFKYPKVGQKNALVSAHLYDLSSGKTLKVDLGDQNEHYIPRVDWTTNEDLLCITKLNRHQNDLTLYLYDCKKKRSKVLLEEKNSRYIDVTDDLTFLKDGKHFIWSSEKEGFQQLYLYDMEGKQKHKLTPGAYDVTKFYGLDEKEKKIYFQALEKSPLHKEIFSADLDGTNIVKLVSSEKGSNSAQFSKTFDYFSNTFSTINSAPVVSVYDRTGNKIRTIEDNVHYEKIQQEFSVSPVEFFTFKTSEGVSLNGWMIKPKNFDRSKKYPVFMTQYSGPGSQSVTDAWKGSAYWWNQLIAQAGYMVVCVDGRGTGGRGEEFRKMTYLKLGYYETIDQIETAKYLGSLDYVDASRVGIFGWSYGGFMSSMCILKGAEFFKAAIAIAPVTHWKWYDTIYSERYMKTMEENSQGYDENSPINFADKLKGHYLLVHGMADDNVHFQHSVEMANALIKANKQFDTYYYPNRNHGISGDNATLHLYTKMTNFIFEKI